MIIEKLLFIFIVFILILVCITIHNRIVRANELVRQKLETAKIRAEMASQAKGQFLANMSHEIRTPMNAIIGMTYLALNTKLTTQQQEYLRAIDTAAKSLLGVINDILDFSKIEAKKLFLENTPFHLEQVITNAISIIRHHANSKGIELLLDIHGDTKIFYENNELIGDPLRLGQVLSNLLSNAVKFTLTGQVHLILNIHHQDLNLANIEFSVKDTGIGMTQQQIATLFQEFNQTEESVARKYGGTGLGLAISKHLVELMGGCIQVKSYIHQGSTFCFTLSFPINNIEKKMETELLPITIPNIIRFYGMRVLSVEDNIVNQQLLLNLLNNRGVSVDFANNGSDAIEMLATLPANHYSLILMDVQMPVLNGYDTTKRLRMNHKYNNLPIVGMTAHALLEERKHGLELGMNDYITKPFDPKELFSLLSKYYQPNMTNYQPTIFNQLNNQYINLPNIPGLNLQQGLLHCDNDEELYLSLLQSFYIEYHSIFSDIRNALEARNWAEATRMAHSLKGLAQTLGMEQIAPVAEELEHSARIQNLGTFGILPSLLSALKPILDGICTFPSLDITPISLTSINAITTELNLNQLKHLLAEGDAEALELWKNHTSTFTNLIPHTTMQKLQEAFNKFDFSLALELLNTVKND